MAEEVAVSSVVYNLAGDEAKRPDYLKTLIAQNIFTPASKDKKSMGETISQGHLHGPGMKLRSFYRWAARAANYDQIGLPTGSITLASPLNMDAVRAAISYPPTYQSHKRDENGELMYDEFGEPIYEDLPVTMTLESAVMAQASARWWAERWMVENRPADRNLNWSYQIDSSGSFITIIMPAGSPEPLTEVIAASSPVYNASSWYVFARYNLSHEPGLTRVFIYGIGSGNADLDDTLEASTSYGQFFPFIPIRLENKFLSESYLPAAWSQVKKAYKKATDGADVNELIDKIAENNKLSDIDHAYVVFGVSLNVLEKSCKRYLYQFFTDLQQSQNGGATSTSTDNVNLITIKGQTSVSNSYDVRLEWRYISSGSGTGLGKVGARVGELWFSKQGTTNGHEILRLYWQRTSTSYTYLDIVGAIHRNYIYKSHHVEIKAFAAIDDTEESGFIVPLHYDTWRRASLVDTTQMATACVFIVFNCYVAREIPWWESWWFKILLVIVIAVVSVTFTGGAGVGLLGSHMALGSTLGFSGMTAAIVGSVVNALASMALMMVLEPILQKMGALGSLAGFLIMFAIGQASASLNATGSMTINWGDLLRVDNLLGMTNALGQGFANQINMDTQALRQSTLDYAENAKRETEEIQQAYFEEFGYGAGIINPMMLVDANRGLFNESSSTFLARTLMTGSEVAEMSRELLYEFPYYSLKLPDAFT